MAKVGEEIEKNIDCFKTLVRVGAISISYCNYYKMYTFYKSLSKIPSKMDRYQFTAESFNTDSRTVVTAIKKMEKEVRGN